MRKRPLMQRTPLQWCRVDNRLSNIVHRVHVMRVRMNVLLVYYVSVSSHVSSLSRRSSLVVVGALKTEHMHTNTYMYIHIHTYTHTYIYRYIYIGGFGYICVVFRGSRFSASERGHSGSRLIGSRLPHDPAIESGRSHVELVGIDGLLHQCKCIPYMATNTRRTKTVRTNNRANKQGEHRPTT